MGGIVVSQADDEEWDAFVAVHPEGHHEQCTFWLQTRTAVGLSGDRIVVRRGSRIVGGLQMLGYRLPFGMVGQILRAPLAIDDDPEVLASVVEELERVASRRSCLLVRVETFPTQTGARAALEQFGFEPSRDCFGVRASLLVPLAANDNELLARMKSKARYNVRLAQRSGVTVEVGDDSSLAQFFDLYEQSASYDKFASFPREYFDQVWRRFHPAHKAQRFVAYHEGQPIAAIFNMIVGGRSYYCWGGMSRQPEHRKLMANYLLHFEAIRWSRDHGCTHYDLVGVTDFKKKLGGDAIRWPMPQCKFYGSLRGLACHFSNLAWGTPGLRHAVTWAARQLFPPLPY